MRFFLSQGVGGYDGDGDIFREDNLIEFRKFVLESTNNRGVHFVMADGVSTSKCGLICHRTKLFMYVLPMFLSHVDKA